MGVWGSTQQFLLFAGWVKLVPFAEQNCCFSKWRSLCCTAQSTEPLITMWEQEFSKYP